MSLVYGEYKNLNNSPVGQAFYFNRNQVNKEPSTDDFDTRLGGHFNIDATQPLTEVIKNVDPFTYGIVAASVAFGKLYASSCAQNAFETLHNDAVKDDSWMKYLKIAAIELGFVANVLVIAPVQLVLGLVVSAVALIFAGFAYCAEGEAGGMVMLGMATSFIALPALDLAQAAVSAYTNLAHPNSEIAYNGQAECHLLCGAPGAESSLTNGYEDIEES